MLRVSLAKLFGWTLDYIDSLSLPDIMSLHGILQGQNMYEEKMSKR